jgi:hypothetical protein
MIIYNAKLAQKIGIEAALLYGAFQTFQKEGKPQLWSVTEMEEQTALSKYQIRKAIAALETAGLLESKLIGSPPVRRIDLKGAQTA